MDAGLLIFRRDLNCKMKESLQCGFVSKRSVLCAPHKDYRLKIIYYGGVDMLYCGTVGRVCCKSTVGTVPTVCLSIYGGTLVT